jgi:extradiol dioxygenase family protein
VPQRKAHVAILVEDLDGLAKTLAAENCPVRWDETVDDRRRFYTDDPFGNRLEFIASGDEFSEQRVPLVGE